MRNKFVYDVAGILLGNTKMWIFMCFQCIRYKVKRSLLDVYSLSYKVRINRTLQTHYILHLSIYLSIYGMWKI